jgi:hypothetical protein
MFPCACILRLSVSTLKGMQCTPLTNTDQARVRHGSISTDNQAGAFPADTPRDGCKIQVCKLGKGSVPNATYRGTTLTAGARLGDQDERR